MQTITGPDPAFDAPLLLSELTFRIYTVLPWTGWVRAPNWPSVRHRTETLGTPPCLPHGKSPSYCFATMGRYII